MNELTTCIYNNFHDKGRNATSLEIQAKHSKTHANVRLLCKSY